MVNEIHNNRTLKPKKFLWWNRFPVGYKIFLGFLIILILVLIGNLTYLRWLQNFNLSIKKTSAGIYRVAISQKLQNILRQQNRFRNTYFTVGPPQKNSEAIAPLDRFIAVFESETKKLKKNQRDSEQIKNMRTSLRNMKNIADSALALSSMGDCLSARELMSSGSVKNLSSKIINGIEFANKNFGTRLSAEDFKKSLYRVETNIDAHFYSFRFFSERDSFTASAESLSALCKMNKLSDRSILFLSDSLGKIFNYESRTNSRNDPAWSAIYVPLADSLEAILREDIGGINVTLARSSRMMSQSRKLGTYGAIALFALGIVIAILISRKISRPILKLREATHSARRGEWNRRIESETNDEIGDLTDDFNGMLAELGELESVKSRFLASITHDLKSPIGRIRGNVANLQDGLVGPISESQREILEMMAKDIDKLSRLIQDILDLQKMKAGAFKLDIREFELKPMILKTLEQFAHDFIDKEIEIGVKLPIDGVKIHADEKQLERVIDNLISNSLKYTSSGGKIIVESFKQNNKILFRVFDNGIGIPPEHIEHVFGEFYQVENKIINAKGTGLGLAITKEIVEAHGGKIEVQSEPNVGTVFSFYIPHR